MVLLRKSNPQNYNLQTAVVRGVMCMDKAMREVSKINLEIVFWSFVLNPGAIILGLCMYSLALPESAIPRFLGNATVNYILIVLAVLLLLGTGWRVHGLSKRKREIRENT